MNKTPDKTASHSLRQLHHLHTHRALREELHVYSRLLYKNRNQHRRSSYFHKLEKVRRTLEKLSCHSLWSSLKQSITEADRDAQEIIDDGMKVGRRRRDVDEGGGCLRFGSWIVDDLLEVESVLRGLLKDVCKAGVFVGEELIARGHFMGFAVCVSACLARVFVLEREVLKAVRGALVGVRVVLGVGEGEGEDLGVVVGGEDVGREGIGEETEMVVRDKGMGSMGDLSEVEDFDGKDKVEEKKELPFGNLFGNTGTAQKSIYELIETEIQSTGLQERQEVRTGRVTIALKEDALDVSPPNEARPVEASHETGNTIHIPDRNDTAASSSKPQLQIKSEEVGDSSESSDTDMDDIFAALD